MKFVASTLLIVASTLLLGFYALVWLISPVFHEGRHHVEPLVDAFGLAGLAFAVLACIELRRQRKEVTRLKTENEEFV